MKKILSLMALLPLFSFGNAQQILSLYDQAIPNSIQGPDQEHSEINSGILVISHVSRPTLTRYSPPAGKANGTAIIIIPGGGYGIVAAGHEGADFAQAFTAWGITAFVLKYRLPDDAIMPNKEIGPLQDAQRAIQLVREHAHQWGLNPRHIGIIGFSAGGHLAASAGTHFNKSLIDNPLRTSLRPDFMILAYPVISFTDSLGHLGSRDNLLGKNPGQEKIRYYSNELQVTHQTPPTFLVHAKDDEAVKVENSLAFQKALQAHQVPVEVHLFEKGGHGFGLHNPTSTVNWLDWLKPWLQKHHWLSS